MFGKLESPSREASTTSLPMHWQMYGMEIVVEWVVWGRVLEEGYALGSSGQVL